MDIRPNICTDICISPVKSEVYRFCPFSLPLRNIFHHKTTLAYSSEWWVIPTPHPRQCELLLMEYSQENKISILFVLRSERDLLLVLLVTRIEYMPTAHINNCVINNTPPTLWEEVYIHVLVTQSCLTLCNPTDCNPPGSSVPGILQASVLEWPAFPSPEDLPNPGIEPWSPTLQADSLPFELQGSPVLLYGNTTFSWRRECFPFCEE